MKGVIGIVATVSNLVFAGGKSGVNRDLQLIGVDVVSLEVLLL